MTARIPSFLLVLTVLMGCTARHATLMTYNVGAFSKYQECSIPDVAAIIRASGADIVSLNELDSCNRRHGYFQADSLASVLSGWDKAFASAFPFAGGAYGNGVVSRFPVLRRARIALPVFDGSEPRSVSVVETKEMVFASTHLDFAGVQAQRLQVETINAWFRETYSDCRKPVFLCGDMNALPASETLSLLQEQWEILSPEEPTFPSDGPRVCIDYILHWKHSAPVRSFQPVWFGEDLKKETASDHLPVTVSVKW